MLASLTEFAHSMHSELINTPTFTNRHTKCPFTLLESPGSRDVLCICVKP